MNGLFVIYANTVHKKYSLMSTDNQVYAKVAQMLLEHMRKNGFLASEITSITVEFQ